MLQATKWSKPATSQQTSRRTRGNVYEEADEEYNDGWGSDAGDQNKADQQSQQLQLLADTQNSGRSLSPLLREARVASDLDSYLGRSWDNTWRSEDTAGRSGSSQAGASALAGSLFDPSSWHSSSTSGVLEETDWKYQQRYDLAQMAATAEVQSHLELGSCIGASINQSPVSDCVESHTPSNAQREALTGEALETAAGAYTHNEEHLATLNPQQIEVSSLGMLMAEELLSKFRADCSDFKTEIASNSPFTSCRPPTITSTPDPRVVIAQVKLAQDARRKGPQHYDDADGQGTLRCQQEQYAHHEQQHKTKGELPDMSSNPRVLHTTHPTADNETESARSSLLGKDELANVFRRYDVDNDNRLDRNELAAMLTAFGLDSAGYCTQKVLDEILTTMDCIDSNGSIDFDEFYTWYVSTNRPVQARGTSPMSPSSPLPADQISSLLEPCESPFARVTRLAAELAAAEEELDSLSCLSTTSSERWYDSDHTSYATPPNYTEPLSCQTPDVARCCQSASKAPDIDTRLRSSELGEEDTASPAECELNSKLWGAHRWGMGDASNGDQVLCASLRSFDFDREWHYYVNADRRKRVF